MKLSLLLPALLLAGCAITHETSVVVGTARAPTNPADVKLYSSPPRQYVDIAIISADASHAFMNKQALVDTAVTNAKTAAAKVGANGILLDGVGDLQGSSTGVVFMQQPAYRGAPMMGIGTANANFGKQVLGKAIYVTEE